MRVRITEAAFEGHRESQKFVGSTGELVFVDPKNGYGLVNVMRGSKNAAATWQPRCRLVGLQPVAPVSAPRASGHTGKR
jgi:hypothetical protein